ncbi:hypothetical protein F3Y22_tig00111358pilonHSYRG00135 [Hibiscus syriacus]|uniref:Uncharacterized protein n=1 Tax=Hibiscus syriacus TaxID=106335 RepID=A0A6A2YNW2_HIBSY|nr:hypothetical protein F3Y22_tig00111358pilonHSYRG00135 [Hibiscus syriacus]
MEGNCGKQKKALPFAVVMAAFGEDSGDDFVSSFSYLSPLKEAFRSKGGNKRYSYREAASDAVIRCSLGHRNQSCCQMGWLRAFDMDDRVRT